MDGEGVSGDGVAGWAVPAALGAVLEKAVEGRRGGCGGDDFDAVWLLLHEARRFGRDAFDAAGGMLASGDAVERVVGCDVLAVLCDPDEEDWGPEVTSAVSRFAEGERDADVLWSVANALHFAGDPRGLPTLVGLAGHVDSDVRYMVAVALPSCKEGSDADLLAGALIGLMGDPDEDVRDSATFGLGTLTGIDGPAVREALFSRLGDENVEVRDEALVGLARRHDRRMVAVVAARLGQEEVGRLAVEAASYVADERLIGPLRALRSWWDVDRELLEDALAACDPERQARDVEEQTAFLALLEPALGGWPGVTVTLSCERLEREVSLVIERDGPRRWYDFRSLVAKRAGGDLAVAVHAVLSDLDAAEPKG